MFARRFGQAIRAAGGLVVATVVFAAAAFASPGANELVASSTKEGGEFRVGMFSILADGTTDPALVQNFGTSELLNATCAYLLNRPDVPLPAGLRLVPEVAADYPVISRNGRTYTFTIRKGFRFSTGAPVTARDFAASLNRILNPALDVPAREEFAGVAGARRVLDGKATTASGVIVERGNLIVRLTKPDPIFPDKMSAVCVLPAGLAKAATDPEGVRAPVPSAGPYFISEYTPGERVVLQRNRFYGGRRPHHVDRFVVTIDSDPEALLDQVERGELDYAFAGAATGQRAQELRKKYGVNKGQFWVQPSQFLRMFVLNTSRPLFRSNPKLRQAVNFAVDRAALVREHGGNLVDTPTDQYLMPTRLGFRDERIYPLRGPDLRTARKLARGRTRSRKAVLYTPDAPASVARAQHLQRNLKAIGLELEIKQISGGGSVYFPKLATPGEPFDIAYVGWLDQFRDPGGFLSWIFDGRTIVNAPNFGDFSYFNSVKYNRLLDRAAQLTGEERYRAYGELDVQISRDAAPAAPYAYDNALTLVSARTGCVVVNPFLDLAAVCLK